MFASLAARPAPGGPQWRIRPPMKDSSSVACGTVDGGEPSMKVRVPALAPTTPPETGASMKVPREGGISVEILREVDMSIVEESMKSFGDVVVLEGL